MPIGEALRSESRSFVLEESGHEVIQKRVLMEKSNISHWVNLDEKVQFIIMNLIF